ncbi:MULTISPECIES: hypothetical protein [unclassified Streptomyces]|uniref:hypothetical protein n=1 Tax=unclassified Streptomyces TaxID=2593676 RepID=UPI002DD7C3FF|nr:MULTISPECIES: hypothetical protein [unclassified Streptomyces]WSA90894.1 hypothetical protein OIE63_04575 [Streptomyces sp. NBC_01795]WSB75217.1 hypothetical protein OHB04_05110 [Streptomyces sp. NBC_01775]WSS16499.1 hypothetical protein OG533_34790 [Streptomyces sp. NBC_01186]WSS45316.1 hypothetical protein OG220_35470 [Streptomyces sp. NBC_01187]
MASEQVSDDDARAARTSRAARTARTAGRKRLPGPVEGAVPLDLDAGTPPGAGSPLGSAGSGGAPAGSPHPVVQIFTEAAKAVPGYPLAPLITDEFCVLIGPGNASSMIAVYFDDVATLWVDQYLWREYEWSDQDTGELGFLAEAVSAVQRGDGAVHFREDDGRLVRLGGRLGTHVIGPGAVNPPPLTLPLTSWSDQLGPVT